MKTGQHYVGYTKDVDRRLIEHNSRLSTYTKSRGPWELIYYEYKKDLKEAEKREKFFKTGDGRRALKIILNKGS